MHRALLNELRLEWTIAPLSPLLISAGEGRFVRTAHPVSGKPTAFIPGGTLKGLLRAAGAGIIESAGLFACTAEDPCAGRPEVLAARGPAAIYKAHCAACRLCGSRAMRGHLTVSDGYPARALDELHMHTLANNEACEMINNEPFSGELVLQNFERWQVALIGSVVAQINAGHMQLGANRGAGMGRIVIRFDAAAFTYFGFYPDQVWSQLSERVHGIGQLEHAVAHTGRPPGPAIYPDVADERDLPDGYQFDSGFGFARILFQGDDPRLVHPVIEQAFFRQLPAWERFIGANLPNRRA